MSLRLQLLLVSLLTLVLPWSGCQYIKEMENALRSVQAQSVLATAQAIAKTIETEATSFHQSTLSRLPDSRTESQLYAPYTSDPMVLDGYEDDWLTVNAYKKVYRRDETNQTLASIIMDSQYLYLWLSVHDQQINYFSPSIANPINGETILLQLESNLQPINVILRTSAPGNVNASLWATTTSLKKFSSIKAVWRDSAKGFNIEIRIPQSLVTHGFGFVVIDIDRGTDGLLHYQTMGPLKPGNAAIDQLSTWRFQGGHLIQYDQDLNTLLGEYQETGFKLSVVDRLGWQLANSKKTTTPSNSPEIDTSPTHYPLLSRFYRQFLFDDFFVSDELKQTNHQFFGNQLQRTLAGQSATSWRLSSNSSQLQSHRAEITASLPLHHNRAITGAVLVSQTSDAILTLTNQALVRLISVSFTAMLLAMLALIAYASWLSIRIRHLKLTMENAMGSSPQHVGGESDPASLESRARPKNRWLKDEITDLYQSYYSLTSRLSEQTDYLKTLASKLSHELRTPLAIVSSSLENINAEELSAQALTYKTRAMEGTTRLRTILSAMSEANRVEESIKSYITGAQEKETFNLAEIVHSSANAYQAIYPSLQFTDNTESAHFPMMGSPELFVQMLDKFIQNAADFTPTEGNIRISLDKNQNTYTLCVINDGPYLPKGMGIDIFSSMVSFRQTKGDTSHLGLGLYIAKLIVTHYGGSISICDRVESTGVIVTVSIPLTDNQSGSIDV